MPVTRAACLKLQAKNVNALAAFVSQHRRDYVQPGAPTLASHLPISLACLIGEPDLPLPLTN